MRRTEALQGVRMISFRSVLDRHEAGELNQFEAGELLGISERTFRRWCRRHEEDGEAGLLDRRLGRPSPKRVPVDDEAEIERLYRTRYRGFTARHFHEHLVRDHLYRVELHLDEAVPAIEGPVGAGAASWRAPPQPAASSATRNDAASGWFPACMAGGSGGDGPDRDDG